jgi:hypothetical protein
MAHRGTHFIIHVPIVANGEKFLFFLHTRKLGNSTPNFFSFGKGKKGEKKCNSRPFIFRAEGVPTLDVDSQVKWKDDA